MEQGLIKGDDVRRGTHIILDAPSKDAILSLGEGLLSENLIHQLNDGSVPFVPMTAQDIAQSEKTSGELVFAIRLLADKSVIGMCRLSHVEWQARHAQLHISIVDDAYFIDEMLIDVMQTVLQFAYWEANLNRISMHCVEDQVLLQDALAQAGFTHEGTLRQDVYRNGRYWDMSIYSILRREWSG